jgi:AcrR family transcriptional regulator
MRANKPDDQKPPSFITKARLAQIIEVAIETIATLGYGQASLTQIASRAVISKSVILYYFKNKEDLTHQVMTKIYTDAGNYMSPRVIAESTAIGMLRTYIQSNIEYIRLHPMQMIAIMEIMQNVRTEDGRIRLDAFDQDTGLAPLEAIFAEGQQNGEFRAFDRRVMAMAIRGAIDALPPRIAAHANLDITAYGQELITLFERATHI